jgi:hypothetical protein
MKFCKKCRVCGRVRIHKNEKKRKNNNNNNFWV